jgi:hypothetical protein
MTARGPRAVAKPSLGHEALPVACTAVKAVSYFRGSALRSQEAYSCDR